MKRLILIVSVCIVACNPAEKKSGPTEKKSESNWKHLQGNAQGTTFSIKYEGEEDFSNEINQIFKRIDDQLSTYIETSLISRINNSNGNPPPIEKTNTYFIDVFLKSKKMYNLTNGSFNPMVYPLVEYWGFGTNGKKPDQIDSMRIVSLLNHINFDSVSYNHADNLLQMPANMKFDFNGIAQGYTVDVISDFLLTKGVSNFMVEVGGEVRANGKNDRDTYWNIGIEKPTDINAEHSLQATVELKKRLMSMATSGNYRKFYEKEGIRYSHTIDPETGYPVQHTLLSATVLTYDCTQADALATAFMVLGLEKTKEFVTGGLFDEDILVYLIYSDENGNFKTWVSEGMKKLINEDI